jgi:pyridoxal phosphate enzyme (YggS family)
MTIKENLKYIQSQLPGKVRLVAVSKTRTNDEILEAYQSGQRQFGENKVQELTKKCRELPKDIEWHYIGHLQTNKVKQLVPFVSMIHSIDSLKLLSTINKEAGNCNRVIPVLLEFHIAREESKFGLTLEEAEELLSAPEIGTLSNVVIAGVMGMATFTDDTDMIKSEFRTLRSHFEYIKQKYFSQTDQFREISMGMSDDYPIAVSEGSTIVRVGSKIFGTRNGVPGLLTIS